MSEPNIYQRINAVMRKVEYVQKDAQVSAGAGGKILDTRRAIACAVLALVATDATAWNISWELRRDSYKQTGQYIKKPTGQRQPSYLTSGQYQPRQSTHPYYGTWRSGYGAKATRIPYRPSRGGPDPRVKAPE